MTKKDFEEMGLYNVDKWFGKRENFTVFSLSEMLGERQDVGMYVVTSTDMEYGADVLRHPKVLEEIAEKLDSDLCILPSSIHEIIVLPETMLEGNQNLTAMVRKINSEVVECDIWLGKDQLRYVRGSMKVAIA